MERLQAPILGYSVLFCMVRLVALYQMMSPGGRGHTRFSVLIAWCGVWLYIRLCHLVVDATPDILCCSHGAACEALATR